MEEIQSKPPQEEQMNSLTEDTSSSSESPEKKSYRGNTILIVAAVIVVLLVVGVVFKLVQRSAGTPSTPTAQIFDTDLESLDAEIERAEKEEGSLDDRLDDLEALPF